MKKIGFIVNPIAGIGGKVGLKGSDGKENMHKALALGAKKESAYKAGKCLEVLTERRDEIIMLTVSGEMGENIAKQAGFRVEIVKMLNDKDTCAADTKEAALKMREAGADIIVFAGGDGTARDVLDAVGSEVPVIGIPAGCKIYSAVYAINPRKAGELLLEFVDGKVTKFIQSEVLDLNEERFRQDVWEAKLYGYLYVPVDHKYVQHLKTGGGTKDDETVENAAEFLVDEMEENVLYIIGSGSTTGVLMDCLELKYTLLGIDLVYNGEVIANDVSEQTLLQYLTKYKKVKLIVTVMGGQGYLFGRGNQQLSAGVLERIGKENIMIMASKYKMQALEEKMLLVDTGDDRVNELLCGNYDVIVGYRETMKFEAKC